MSTADSIRVRNLRQEDCQTLSNGFAAQGWSKPREQYEEYLREQGEGKRSVLVAELDGELAGYLTIVWASHYPLFREKGIPEIVDLNVYIKFRNKGVASALMDEAERQIKMRSSVAGIGVGLLADYGAAQRLYVKRGYVPDGLGISYNGEFPEYFDRVTVDDDLILCFTKDLA